MSLRISTIVFLILVLAGCGERQASGSRSDASESAPTLSSIQKAAAQGIVRETFELTKEDIADQQ